MQYLRRSRWKMAPGRWGKINLPACLKRLTSETGSAYIEAAVGFAVLLCVMVAVLQLSLAFYTYHFVGEAAREASRFAMVRGSSSCTNSPNLSYCNATSDQVATWVRGLEYPGINPNNLTVSVTWPSTGSNCYPSASPCNNPGNLVNVNVAYSFPFDVPFYGKSTFNLRSASQMVISQ